MFRHHGVRITDTRLDETGRFNVGPEYYLESYKNEVMSTFNSYLMETPGMDLVDISFVGTTSEVNAELLDAIRTGVPPIDMAMDFIDRAVAESPLSFA